MSLMTVAITYYDGLPDKLAVPFMRALHPVLREWGAPLFGVELDWCTEPDGQVILGLHDTCRRRDLPGRRPQLRELDLGYTLRLQQRMDMDVLPH